MIVVKNDNTSLCSPVSGYLTMLRTYCHEGVMDMEYHLVKYTENNYHYSLVC